MTAPAFDTNGMLGSTIKEKLQYERMRSATFRDQHGRKWSCAISTETLHPCSPLIPADFRTPHPYLTPPAKYLQIGTAFGEIVIAYDAWLTDVSEARREWDNWLRECAILMYKGAAVAMMQAQDADLLKMAGPAPMSPEFIKAMKSGESRWVLGLRRADGTKPATPSWAHAILHTLQIVETWDGGYVDTSVQAGRYADDEPDADAAERADRLALALKYADDEEVADPGAARDFQPLKKRSHHKARE